MLVEFPNVVPKPHGQSGHPSSGSSSGSGAAAAGRAPAHAAAV